MDTSETYIKMCKRTKEIQRIWQNVPQELWEGHYTCGYDGSFYWNKPLDSVDDGIRCVDYEHDTSDIKHQVWLPRQDQLQEMMGINTVRDLLGSNLLVGGYGGEPFLSYEFEGYPAGKYDTLTMEQLWLAFYMDEKYNKVWSGTEWVNEDAKS